MLFFCLFFLSLQLHSPLCAFKKRKNILKKNYKNFKDINLNNFLFFRFYFFVYKFYHIFAINHRNLLNINAIFIHYDIMKFNITMRIRHLIILFTLLCVFITTLPAQEVEKSLFIKSAKESSSISIKEIRSIKYRENKILISSFNGTSETWDITDIAGLYFGINETTDINPVSLGTFELNGNILHITSPTDATLLIYDLSGRILYNHNISSSPVKIDTSKWNKGVYIINIDKKTFKLLKR